MHDRTESKWRKSSRSSSGNCVEVKIENNRVHMRDSKDRSGPVLSFDRDVFRAFLDDLRADEHFPA